jgi:hypothetical protein
MNTNSNGERVMSHSQTRAFPGASEWEEPRPRADGPVTDAGAFAGGFIASLIGGLLYCAVLFHFYPAELESAGFRGVSLALTFGAFEVWRVKRKRTLRSARMRLCWTVVASLLVLWALGALFSPAERSRKEAPRRSIHLALNR